MNKEISLTMSPEAYNHIRSILSHASDDSKFCLSIVKYGCSGYGFKPEISKDKFRSYIPVKVDELEVYVEPRFSSIIHNTHIDWVEKELGQKQLMFNNKRLHGACGCGDSFELPEDFDKEMHK